MSGLVAYGNFLFRYRNGLFALVLFALLFGLPPHPFGGDLASDRWLDLIGLLVALAGQGLRAAVIGLAYIKRGGLNKKVHADDLVTDGLFRHCRNPLYVGNLLILAGLFIIHNNPWVYLLGGAFFVSAYIAIVAAEEHFLAGRFGQAYADFCRQTPRWWIDPRGLRATLAGMRFNWKRVLAKDYASAFTWIVTALAVMAWEAVQTVGWEAARPRLEETGTLALTGLLLVLVVRWLKKRRLLRA
ncbi:MAG: S-isoprenylcysteine methyltransferase [Gammaproteobacteria bacterium]|nr:MAG: S-isoprenylcysteine methyltransferase [Gammaproteobacteria bacterium]